MSQETDPQACCGGLILRASEVTVCVIVHCASVAVRRRGHVSQNAGAKLFRSQKSFEDRTRLLRQCHSLSFVHCLVTHDWTSPEYSTLFFHMIMSQQL